MALVTAIAATTNQTANSGVVDLGSVVNKWSAQLVTSGQRGRPSFNFSASCDGTNYSKAEPFTPTLQKGDWLAFETPARYVVVIMGANTGSAAVFLQAQTD